MSLATHASLVIARFDEARKTGEVEAGHALFLKAAADVRAAARDVRSQTAYVFAVYGLHTSKEAAQETVANRFASAPWLAEAADVRAAVLEPFRHFGEANYLGQPGPVFEVSSMPQDDGDPVLIVTSVGWNSADGEAKERISLFSDNVAAVRIGLGGAAGLVSQNSFSFPGGLAVDGITVTVWRNLRSAMAFAYGPGHHRTQVKLQRETLYGDRTSFTRFRIDSTIGDWLH